MLSNFEKKTRLGECFKTKQKKDEERFLVDFQTFLKIQFNKLSEPRPVWFPCFEKNPGFQQMSAFRGSKWSEA